MIIRAFLSFVEEDLNLVNLFRGQAKSDRNELEFQDYSIKEPFDSRNADYIARNITDQIKYSSITICLYGPTTYKSKWVEWELNKALELKKPIMGVSLYSDGRTQYHPAPLKDWPRVSWNIQQIVSKMEELVSG